LRVQYHIDNHKQLQQPSRTWNTAANNVMWTCMLLQMVGIQQNTTISLLLIQLLLIRIILREWFMVTDKHSTRRGTTHIWLSRAGSMGNTQLWGRSRCKWSTPATDIIRCSDCTHYSIVLDECSL
jgi:hypothetical protein